MRIFFNWIFLNSLISSFKYIVVNNNYLYTCEIFYFNYENSYGEGIKIIFLRYLKGDIALVPAFEVWKFSFFYDLSACIIFNFQESNLVHFYSK